MSEKGTVIKSTGSRYEVRGEDFTVHSCRIKGKMRLEDIKSTNPVAVGDYVLFSRAEVEGDDGVIEELLPRRNYVVRRATNLSKQTHVLAANVDQAILVATINFPVTTPVFIDRFLVSAEAYQVPVVIVFNKTDRYNSKHKEELEQYTETYRKMGYDVIHISAKNSEGIEEVRERLKDKVSVIAGHSGVGKSTLINKIEPGLNLRVDEISEFNNAGKHTTTNAEMHPFSFGGYVVDTPGIRGFGIANIEREELPHYFRDIFAVSSRCQYNNCTHTHEPGCAVKQAVVDGLIAESRYHSYLNVMETDTAKYR